MSTEDLVEAARLARLASDTAHERTIEVIITEIGFVVRGSSLDSSGRRWKSLEVPIDAYDKYPHLLANAVRLVNDRLPNAVKLP